MGIAGTFALYEFKLTLRSRVFRIFAVLALLVMTGLTVFLYTPANNWSQWALRAVPSSIPYMMVIFFNIFSVIGGMFIVTEFIERDRKLGTTDATYYRNFPTPLYFAGKAAGVLGALMLLESVLLLVPFGMTLFFLTDTPVSIIGFLLYPLLLTAPLLLFMTGMSWVFMLVTKSQPAVFIAGIVVLGVAVWTNSITGMHQILDYPGFGVPAMYSDFVGFGDTSRLLMQRGMFALAGIGLMAAASLMLPRLGQSPALRRAAAGLVVVMVVSAAVLATIYMGRFSENRQLRDELRALNREYRTMPRVTLTDCDLALTHTGGSISAGAALTIVNDTDAPLDTYLFSLNHALAVDTVSGHDRALPFTRNRHLIFVTPPEPLAPGAADSLVITYAGTVDQESCYLDIPESERIDSYPVSLMTAGLLFGAITRDFVLLTPETGWYPVAGIPYGSSFPELGKKDFTRFTLTVGTASGLVPVSQGLPETLPDGRTRFSPATPLPQIGLTIANYQRQAMTLDSLTVTCAIYTLPGHDYYTQYLDGYADDFKEHITRQLQQRETQFLRSYPYDYLTVVEVPVQFNAFRHLWTVVQDNVQPGVMLVCERGIYMQDIPSLARFIKRETRIAAEQRGSMLVSNALYPLYDETYSINPGSLLMNRQPLLSLSTVYRLMNVEDDMIYNIYPNFYSFTNQVESSRWPVIDTMLERYLSSGVGGENIRISSSSTITANYANKLLSRYSLAEIFESGESSDALNAVMAAKMNQLFAGFSARFGTQAFADRLAEYLYGSQYGTGTFSALIESLAGGDAGDLEPFIDEWYRESGLPICLCKDIAQVEIPGNERTYYQMRITLHNPSETEGLFQLSGYTLNPNPQPNETPYEEFSRFVTIPAGTARCVLMLGDYPFYSGITVNTIVSQNLPSRFSVPVPDAVMDPAAILADTVLAVDPATFCENPNEIIVDDNGPGCVYDTPSDARAFVHRILYGETEDDYIPAMTISQNATWERYIDGSFHGDYIMSGLCKASGDGSQPVRWETEITEPGVYDIYTHSCSIARSMIYMSSSSEPEHIVGALKYTITHINGSDIIKVIPAEVDDEWIYLGTFDFAAGPASVELSDKSEGMMVFADAIKWVRQ